MNGDRTEGCVWYCWYCNCLLTDENSSVDHVIPWSRGGSHRPQNLVAACRRCNSSKGNKTIPEWRLRNVLARVTELRYQYMGVVPFEQCSSCRSRPSKPGVRVVCLTCESRAQRSLSEYAAFDRALKPGQLACYVDLPKLKTDDIKRLTVRHSPARVRYCRRCGVNH